MAMLQQKSSSLKSSSAKTKPRRILRKWVKAKKKKHVDLANLSEDIKTDGVDLHNLVQNEFLRLHRQYRKVEHDRHLVIEKGNTLSRQSRILRYLTDVIENDETDFYNATCPLRLARDERTHRTILEILEYIDSYRVEIRKEMRNVRDMRKNVDRISQVLIQHSLKVRSVFGQTMGVAQALRKMRHLETKLHNATVKHDTTIAKNRACREEISMDLRLRGLFYEKYSFLKRRMHFIRNQMNVAVFYATTSYDQRDNTVAKIRILRDKNDKETKAHVLEIKDLHRMIDNDSRLRHFLRVKAMRREVGETDQQRLNRKNYINYMEMQGVLNEYCNTFITILREYQLGGHSSVQDMSTLENRYRDQESSNFSMFRRGTDVNQEVIVLENDILESVTEIDKLYAEDKVREKEREQELKKLEQHLDDLKFQEVLMKRMLDRKIEDMIEVTELVDDITREENIRDPLALLLDYNGRVTLQNACLAMRSIEFKCYELVGRIAELEARKSLSETGRLPSTKQYRGGQRGGGPFAPDVMLYMLETNDEEPENDRVPITYQEIKAKVLLELPKRGRMPTGRHTVSESVVHPSFISLSRSSERLSIFIDISNSLTQPTTIHEHRLPS